MTCTNNWICSFALGAGLTALVCAGIYLRFFKTPLIQTGRIAQYPIGPVILNRTSHYSFDGSMLTEQQIGSLFEAARWAPSSYNNQPWRIIYGLKGTPQWQQLLNLMVDFNQQWARHASLLMLVVSKKTMTRDGKEYPNPTHSFDTGAAVENLALQATALGLSAHAMAGFDTERAAQMYGITDPYTVEVMVAVGKPGYNPQLPEFLQKRAEVVSDRLPVSSWASSEQLVP